MKSFPAVLCLKCLKLFRIPQFLLEPTENQEEEGKLGFRPLPVVLRMCTWCTWLDEDKTWFPGVTARAWQCEELRLVTSEMTPRKRVTCVWRRSHLWTLPLYAPSEGGDRTTAA